MKLNEPTLADPLLLTGCALGGPPWGSGGPFTTQDLISTTTFHPDDNLLLSSPPPHNHSNNGVNNSNSNSPPSSALNKGSCPTTPNGGSTGVELDALLIVGSSDSFAELKPLPPFEYAAAGTTAVAVVGALSLQNDPHLPQMGPAPNQHSNNNHHHHQNHPHNHQHNNNNSSRDNLPNPHRGGNNGGGSTGANSLVSSPNGTNFSSSVGGSPLFDPVSSSTTTSSVPANIKSELAEYLLNSDIDDIAALIGNAIADSTVPNLGLELDPNGVSSSADTPDPWMEFETWIESACQQSQQQQQQSNSNNNNNGVGGVGRGSLNQNGGQSNNNNNNNNVPLDHQDATIHTSASDQSFLDGSTSTLQTLLEADSYSGGGPQNNNPMFHQDMKHNPAEFHPTSILQSRLNQFQFTFKCFHKIIPSFDHIPNYSFTLLKFQYSFTCVPFQYNNRLIHTNIPNKSHSFLKFIYESYYTNTSLLDLLDYGYTYSRRY